MNKGELSVTHFDGINYNLISLTEYQIGRKVWLGFSLLVGSMLCESNRNVWSKSSCCIRVSRNSVSDENVFCFKRFAFVRDIMMLHVFRVH